MTMGYRIEYRRDAARYLERMNPRERTRILEAIEELGENPDGRTPDVKKLRNRSGFRLRVGKYRVLYGRFDDRLLILVVAVRLRFQGAWGSPPGVNGGSHLARGLRPINI
jgi:mRNA interferase RelE/StbE